MILTTTTTTTKGLTTKPNTVKQLSRTRTRTRTQLSDLFSDAVRQTEPATTVLSAVLLANMTILNVPNV